MTRKTGPADDRDADRPSRPLAMTLGLIAMATVLSVGVAGILLILRHGVAVPLQRHAVQAKAAWKRATSSPAEEDDAPRESPPSETEIAILPLGSRSKKEKNCRLAALRDAGTSVNFARHSVNYPVNITAPVAEPHDVFASQNASVEVVSRVTSVDRHHGWKHPIKMIQANVAARLRRPSMM